jgi:predicted nucleic acid-binding protein
MILVVDASTLVGELVRKRGRALFRRRDVQFLVADEQWLETERGLERRLETLRTRIDPADAEALADAVRAVVDSGALRIVPRDVYAAQEAAARRRVRDQTDWPTVALALAADAAILTADQDFFGSGVATWTYGTLAAELEAQSGEEAGVDRS